MLNMIYTAVSVPRHFIKSDCLHFDLSEKHNNLLKSVSEIIRRILPDYLNKISVYGFRPKKNDFKAGFLQENNFPLLLVHFCNIDMSFIKNVFVLLFLHLSCYADTGNLIFKIFVSDRNYHSMTSEIPALFGDHIMFDFQFFIKHHF